ncbi:MAG: galactosyldiacylglycerol synthase [Hydrogenophaga sp.]|uniref:galactosyldiacylglycerol synthase n=1 Tax=Hydrogenophaga sp. TaxID=1904254 RepID=UPI00271E48BD|nr:galactosyldiacylglycerol synthase [Hydrogenophaga sp.]MDO9147880.1 galactosyldiacylglycerol synthase [Hydrogenophaga sp.]MDO9603955.1 galactosyldiacylglycerol synthase [Hydrogenophaga sp.]MDP3475208.1 galactosyldiacylglycerol synthase [Hydrogenophaga sp.]
MLNVDLVWFNAGGGHRAAADALSLAIGAQRLPWRVRKVNFTEVIDPAGRFRRVMGFDPEDLYNKRLASGFTLGLSQELKLLQRAIRWSHPLLVERLAAHWRATKPDLVVSLIPNFNRALHDGLAQAQPQTPFVTVLTDMADHPPAFWVEPGTGQHVVCGTAHAYEQALAAGCPQAQVHRVSGMLLRPTFHERAPMDRARERAALGLDPKRPVGLVMFGGAGSRAMKRIATTLPDVPLILLCGRNEALAQSLRALPAVAPRVVVGFTSDVAYWMQLADFFVGKPGPGAISEAVQMGLPVIVASNAWTLPQERWNAEWVRQQGVGLTLRSFNQVDVAVGQLLPRLEAFQQRAAAVRNRAALEVPQCLESILNLRQAAVAEWMEELAPSCS